MQWVLLQSNKNSTMRKYPVSDPVLIEIERQEILFVSVGTEESLKKKKNL